MPLSQNPKMKEMGRGDFDTKIFGNKNKRIRLSIQMENYNCSNISPNLHDKTEGFPHGTLN